jgi:hypothetical protein
VGGHEDATWLFIIAATCDHNISTSTASGKKRGKHNVPGIAGAVGGEAAIAAWVKIRSEYAVVFSSADISAHLLSGFW